MTKKIIYVLAWSLGLLYATFPWVFTSKFQSNFALYPHSSLGAIIDEYLRPLVLALALFISDVCYVFEQEKQQGPNAQKYVVEVLMLVCAFLFGLIYSISCGFHPECGFIFAWIALTMMKFLKTSICKKDTPHMPQGVIIADC